MYKMRLYYRFIWNRKSLLSYSLPHTKLPLDILHVSSKLWLPDDAGWRWQNTSSRFSRNSLNAADVRWCAILSRNSTGWTGSHVLQVLRLSLIWQHTSSISISCQIFWGSELSAPFLVSNNRLVDASSANLQENKWLTAPNLPAAK